MEPLSPQVFDRNSSAAFTVGVAPKTKLLGLLAEDSPADRYLVRKYLSHSPSFEINLVEVDTVSETIRCLKEGRFQFLLLDLRLKDGGGTEILERLGHEFPSLPTIILTGLDQIEVAVMAMRQGAQDYLSKDAISTDSLTRAIWYAMERHQVVEKLARAKDHVEKADRAKTEFLANMSHEMRTPLSVILASVDLLNCEKGSFSKEAMMSIEMIRSNSHHLLSLVDGLLDVTRLELGILSTKTKRFSLLNELAPTFHSLELVAKKKGIHFEVSSTIEPTTEFTTDPIRLTQVLFNVAGNAIKFTDEGKVSVEVCVAASDPRLLTFRISDTGPGILPEHQTQLFTPFFQGDSSPARRHGGAGLGLALTHRIAKALGGDIRLVKTSLVEGTVFEFSLPDRCAETANKEKAIAATPTDSACLLLRGRRILLVEDCTDNQRLIRFFIERAGAKVTIASDGIEGVEAAMREDFDLVLMDMQLPILDGYGATRELRRLGFSKPIIALTAHAMGNEREKCLAAGCSEYISKPFEHQEFILKLAAQAHHYY